MRRLASVAKVVLIAADDVVEHFPNHAAVAAALGNWTELLLPGGRLHLRLPDTAAQARAFVAGRLTFEQFERRLFGARNYPENAHHTGWSSAFAERLLQQFGYHSIRIETRDLNLWLWAAKPS